MSARQGNLFIVSGPSGAGKGTLVRALLARVPDLWLSVSSTTRAPRPGEEEGIHYFFLSRKEFDRKVESGGFLEWAEVHSNRYGTSRDVVERKIDQGRQVVLEIDPQGAQQVKERMPQSVLIFVNAPDLSELRKRLFGRGSETEEQIEARMARAIEEMELAGLYDFVITNDDVVRATDELVGIIDSYADKAPGA
ncbi:MAG: guanylate kinase [Actinobacteria bacterium]|nr:guanylate kinase [Actinomycetota bacterium]MCG2808572.1 guanylate kinase [Coriobacteriia bacterium]